MWFTGLPASGKSTLAAELQRRLVATDRPTEWLDGDEVRQHLSRGLGYSRADRDENIARIAYVARVLARQGVIVLVSAVSPYREARFLARQGVARFVEVWVNAPLETCRERDPKGLYRRAAAGEIAHLTGWDDPYEPPEQAEVECRTAEETISACVDKVLGLLQQPHQQ